MNASPAGEGELYCLAIIPHEEKSLVFSGGNSESIKQIYFIQSMCVSICLFSIYSRICFRHSLPKKPKVFNDECDCPLLCPAQNWVVFSLSPECMTVSHRLWGNEEVLDTHSGSLTVLFCLAITVSVHSGNTDFGVWVLLFF